MDKCRTHEDVVKLSVRELKEECAKRQLNTGTESVSALQRLLCLELGISTTGSAYSAVCDYSARCNFGLDNDASDELLLLTPSCVKKLTGWTSDLRGVPDIDSGKVKAYLLGTEQEEFSAKQLKSYKLSRCWQFIKAESLHSVAFNPLSTSVKFCVVSGQCLPSQSTNSDDVKWLHVVLDKITGQPYAGYCICTVGIGQACAHIGALLFLLAELVAEGIQQVPDGPACTDLLCKWTQHKASKVQPQVLEDVFKDTRKRQKHGTSSNKTFPTVSTYRHLLPPDLPPDVEYQRAIQFRGDLLHAAAEMESAPPALKIISTDRFNPDISQQLASNNVLHNLTFSMLDADFVVTHEEETLEIPPVITALLEPNVQLTEAEITLAVSKLLVDVNSQCRLRYVVEKLTRGQSDNQLWYKYRAGAISGSVVCRIVTAFRKQVASSRLVNDVLQYASGSSNMAMDWGKQHEIDGVNEFVSYYGQTHTGVRISRPGLVIHPQFGYIRASPDAIISCDCCQKDCLLEVKCPFSCKELDPAEAVRSKQIEYVDFSGGKYSVNAKSSYGYYQQIQLTMAAAELDVAYLVVWTKVRILPVPVTFDTAYWFNVLQPAAEWFFVTQVGPELATGRIKCGVTFQVPLPEPLQRNCATSRQVSPDQLTTLQGQSTVVYDQPVSNLSLEALFEEIVAKSDVDEPAWAFGCSNYCCDASAPVSIKGLSIACDGNLICKPNSWFHYACEGFKRKPAVKMLQRSYICTQCRPLHASSKQLQITKGFLTS